MTFKQKNGDLKQKKCYKKVNIITTKTRQFTIKKKQQQNKTCGCK